MSKPNATIWVLAGIGVGVLAGVVAGLVIASRRRDDSVADITDTVDDLRNRAERVLHELSDSISELRDKTQRIAADIADSTEQAADDGAYKQTA